MFRPQHWSLTQQARKLGTCSCSKRELVISERHKEVLASGINPWRRNEFKEKKLCTWKQYEPAKSKWGPLSCVSPAFECAHESSEYGVGNTTGVKTQRSIQDTTADVCSTSAAEDGVKASRSSSFFQVGGMSNGKKNFSVCIKKRGEKKENSFLDK